MLRSAAAAIIVGTAVGCATTARARLAGRRQTVAARTGDASPGTRVPGAVGDGPWSVDVVDDTSELSPYATAIVLDPRP